MSNPLSTYLSTWSKRIPSTKDFGHPETKGVYFYYYLPYYQKDWRQETIPSTIRDAKNKCRVSPTHHVNSPEQRQIISPNTKDPFAGHLFTGNQASNQMWRNRFMSHCWVPYFECKPVNITPSDLLPIFLPCLFYFIQRKKRRNAASLFQFLNFNTKHVPPSLLWLAQEPSTPDPSCPLLKVMSFSLYSLLKL